MKRNVFLKMGRAWLRYSVSTLLILVTCIGCYLAGRNHGYKQGKAIWEAIPVYPIVYKAADLHELTTATQAEPFEDVVSIIKTDVAPAAWDDVGGNCSVAVFSESESLVVSANDYVHEQVRRYLENARKAKHDVGN